MKREYHLLIGVALVAILYLAWRNWQRPVVTDANGNEVSPIVGESPLPGESGPFFQMNNYPPQRYMLPPNVGAFLPATSVPQGSDVTANTLASSIRCGCGGA